VQGCLAGPVIGQRKASAHECPPASRQRWTATEARSTDNNWHRMPDEAHFISDRLLIAGAVVGPAGGVAVVGLVLFWLVDRIEEWLPALADLMRQPTENA
jgi:hypothetical protein